MAERLKKAGTLLLSLAMLLGMAACGGGGGGSLSAGGGPDSADGGSQSSESTSGEEENMNYLVYDSKGELLLETENIFAAYIWAGKRGINSNKTRVVYRGEEIFSWGEPQYYKLIGSEFVGTMDRDDAAAREWAKENPGSYVVTEKAQDYVALGRTDMENSRFAGMNSDAVTQGIEYMSGSYNYMFSKRSGLDADYIDPSYVEFTLDMTKMEFAYPTYEKASDQMEGNWNAYIFTNFFTNSPWASCDIGLIASREVGEGNWKVVFNRNGEMITPAPDNGGEQGEPLATMTQDEETGLWHSEDVLRFRAYVPRSAYCLEVENLTTGENFVFHVDCTSDALQLKAHETYTMIAASYCPVVQGTQMWDARSGAIFRGLRFYNIKTAEFIESATCADDYAAAEKYDFMPDDDSIYSYGFAQGDDNCDFAVGTDEEGTYLESNIYYIEN